MAAAGNAMNALALNLSFILQPCDVVAAMVVSEMKDRLSPKKAPPTTTPTYNGRLSPVAVASPAAMGTRATMHPTLVPMAMLTKHVVRNRPGSSMPPGTTDNMRPTVESMQPMLFAAAANAPASTNTHNMSMMPGVPAPWLNVFMRSVMLPLLVATAYMDASMKATEIGIL